ncbi:DUF1127 domain-containing protein [Pseudomonas sp. PDM14]|uniref:DUF1127 domain-containing protein n=1 Tax=Pseudomonas sp. PDM14 TaxID=2769288 RepID=UPI0017824CC1|nr:DUF1127 domain-containing protein [Pseudomonas sp. PDM14]MBD9481605.1 DUF1127 domain-containing protein [Pseudomonas sp. PDM14]
MKRQQGYAIAHSAAGSQLHFSTIHKAVAAAVRQLRRWWQLAQQRHRLALLDEHALKDIGITRAEAEQEAQRPFWDEPNS